MEFTQQQKELINELRAEWKKGDDTRDSGLSDKVEGVTRYNNINYGLYGSYNLLDVYRPDNTEKVPVIINSHGGGNFYGTKETYQYYCLFLAKQGYAVINFNYRLAPDYQFPANLEDAWRVFNWVSEHADEYNLDTDHVFLVGDSAGGTMTEQLSTIYTNDEYRQRFGFNKTDLHLRAAALNCGGFFTRNYKELPKDTLKGMAYVAGLYNSTHQDNAQYDLTKTEDYINSNFLPVYVMTSSDDFIRSSSISLDKFLTEKKINHEFHDYGSKDNPRPHVFHINQKDDLAKKCNLDELRFFKENMNS